MMMKFSFLGFVATIIYCVPRIKGHYTQQWAVHIEGGQDVADVVARDHGFANHGSIFEDYYHFSHSGVAKRSLKPNSEKKARLAVDTRVKWARQQKAKKRVKRDTNINYLYNDPRWSLMWYLKRGNGLDMNVISAWQEGITGKGAVVTILDDGLERDHPDLSKNYDPMASYDVNGQDNDPTPRYDLLDSNRHGTRCAGEVAATSNNSLCALGVAHGAHVGGVRMLDGDVTDAVEARSLSLNPHHIDIYSASWGPDDDGKTVDGPGELATRAFIEGVSKGRNGKGSIFIWASGNGGRDHDNCNCDGYTNSIYSLSISSATENGNVPWYSEACSSTLASTYSSGSTGEKQIVTTDLKHSCTSSHTGTSASAPLAAGICALALESNPNLTWRDMQHIVVRTARPTNLYAPDWQTNGVGRNVSHRFGYGLMDAYAMVQLARRWITVPTQTKCEITAAHAQKSIPAKSVVVLQLQVKDCPGVQVLEHVQAKLTILSQRRGDLNIQLTSPMGTRVTLLAHRVNDNSRTGFNIWPFMSVHSWGESPLGTWKLEIHNDGRLLGEVKGWQLVLYGTATPPAYETQQHTFPQTLNEEISHNSIEDLGRNWKGGAENRKDTLEVEEKEKSTSGCEKTDGNLCLGCFPNYTLLQGKCITRCPEKYYNSILNQQTDRAAPEVTDVLRKNEPCLACHYMCKNCRGSMDYQCTECYGDAKIVHASSLETYCYPIHIISEVLSEKWYYRMFTMTYVLVIILTVPAAIYIFVKRRKLFNNHFDEEYIHWDTAKNITTMEKSIKTVVYTDSE